MIIYIKSHFIYIHHHFSNQAAIPHCNSEGINYISSYGEYVSEISDSGFSGSSDSGFGDGGDSGW